MKELLLSKKQELEAQMKQLQQELSKAQEQLVMLQGAFQYNEHLLSQVEPKEV